MSRVENPDVASKKSNEISSIESRRRASVNPVASRPKDVIQCVDVMTRTTTVEMPRTEWMFLFKRKLCRAHGWTVRNGNGKRWKRIRFGARADRRLRMDVETNAWVVVTRGNDSNGCRVKKHKKKV